MKNKEKIIIVFLLGTLLFGSVGVYAAIKYNASEIGYKDKTVEEAINDLYSKREDSKLVGQYAGTQGGASLSIWGLEYQIYSNNEYLEHDSVNAKVTINKSGNYTIRYSAAAGGTQSYQPKYIVKVNDEEKDSLVIAAVAGSTGVKELNIDLNKDDYIVGYINGGGKAAVNFTTLIYYNQ